MRLKAPIRKKIINISEIRPLATNNNLEEKDNLRKIKKFINSGIENPVQPINLILPSKEFEKFNQNSNYFGNTQATRETIAKYYYNKKTSSINPRYHPSSYNMKHPYYGINKKSVFQIGFSHPSRIHHVKAPAVNFAIAFKYLSGSLTHLKHLLKLIAAQPPLHSLNLKFARLQITFFQGDIHLRDSLMKCLSKIPKKLLHLKKLELSLIDTKMSEIGMKHFMIALKGMPDEDVIIVPKALCQLTSLKSLGLDFSTPRANLYPSNISDEAVKFITRDLKNLTNLEELNLNFSSTKVGDTGLRFLKDLLVDLPNLKVLKLKFKPAKKYITSIGINSLSKGLSKLNNLTALELTLESNTNINGKCFAKFIGQLLNLAKLNLKKFDLNIKAQPDLISSCNAELTELSRLIQVETKVGKYDQELLKFHDNF